MTRIFLALEFLSEMILILGKSRVSTGPKIHFEWEGRWCWMHSSLMDDEWDEEVLEDSKVIRRMVLVDSSLDEMGWD